jgi:hypothetical protein
MCAHRGALAFTRTTEWFASWKHGRNISPGTTMAFSEMLADRGYEKKRTGHPPTRGFSRLAFKTDYQPE